MYALEKKGCGAAIDGVEKKCGKIVKNLQPCGLNWWNAIDKNTNMYYN